ncbi:hypothetical protein UFOVP1279_67 [uncultured Caudovirales phage]|uniref:Uncharacterized protein n=1 Tax=uncultured Caudovirales phage TaxID=2100421 RepID=A0A6J5RTD1_9CAUD|nr:hypothetical protein UFOVP1279_67 [uncultured Caudovirales phage]
MTNPITTEILREIKENTVIEDNWDFDDIVLDPHSPDYSPERVARVLWLLANDHLVYGSYVDHEPRKYNESLFPNASYSEDRSTCDAATGKWNLTTVRRDHHETNEYTGRQGFLGNLTSERHTVETVDPETGERSVSWHPEFIRLTPNEVGTQYLEAAGTFNELLEEVEAEVTARPKAATERFGVVFLLSGSTIVSEYHSPKEVVSNWIVPVIRPELTRYAPFKELHGVVQSNPRMTCGDSAIWNIFGLKEDELAEVWETLRVDDAAKGIEALLRNSGDDLAPAAKRAAVVVEAEVVDIGSLAPKTRKTQVVTESTFEFSGLAPKGSR